MERLGEGRRERLGLEREREKEKLRREGRRNYGERRDYERGKERIGERK